MHAARLFSRQTTRWVALLLFALATLAPGVSRAMAHVQGQVAPWAQVCSTTPPSGSPEGADLAAHMLDHCPLCAVQGEHPAPPGPAPSTPLLSALSHAVPALFLHAPRPLHAWAPALARGPPALA